MSYVTWKFERTAKKTGENSGWESTTTEITDFNSPLLSLGTKTVKDTFRLSMTNFNGEFSNYFNPNDKLTIYRVLNSDTVTSDDILMIGTVKNDPETQSGASNNLNVTGFNFSESLMSAVIFAQVQNLTIPFAIKHGLDNAGTKNPQFKVAWNDDNPTVMKNGAAFPTVTEEEWYNKPLKKYIEEYSRNERTTDGNYMWYVDNNNKFVWKAQKDNTDHTFNSSTDEHTEIKIGKDINGVRNFIILKGGFDPAGHQIQARYINWESMSKYGTKYYFIVSEANNAKNFIGKDIKATYGDDQSTDGYPDITSASFETSWYVPDSIETFTTQKYNIVVTKGAKVTINEGSEVSNKKAYSEVIREMVKALLLSQGESYAEARKEGSLQVDVEVRAGTKTWGLGDIITCTIPQLTRNATTGVTDTIKNLRVRGIQYSSEQDVYSLEEDKGNE